MKRNLHFCIPIIVYLFITSQTVIAQTLEITFHNKFGGEPIELKKQYTNTHGEKLNITALDYFISNITLTRQDGSVYIPSEHKYFLVKQSAPATHTLRIEIPQGEYTGLSYIIGVDSLRSTMGADHRTGALDVGAEARGMYWRWNAGYIFFKLEGRSSASPDSLQNRFYYHIGGYGGYDTPTINNIRKKILEFGQSVKASAKKDIAVNIDVQIDKLFEGHDALKIGKHPSVMFGPLTKAIADNYVGLFLIGKIESKNAPQ